MREIQFGRSPVKKLDILVMSAGAFLIKQLEILKKGCRIYTAALFMLNYICSIVSMSMQRLTKLYKT